MAPFEWVPVTGNCARRLPVHARPPSSLLTGLHGLLLEIPGCKSETGLGREGRRPVGARGANFPVLLLTARLAGAHVLLRRRLLAGTARHSPPSWPLPSAYPLRPRIARFSGTGTACPLAPALRWVISPPAWEFGVERKIILASGPFPSPVRRQRRTIAGGVSSTAPGLEGGRMRPAAQRRAHRTMPQRRRPSDSRWTSQQSRP